MRFLKSVVLSLMACLVLFSSAASAAPATSTTTKNANFDLTTSPVSTSLVTTPGKSVTTMLKVQNNASQAVNLNVKLMKFKAYGDTGQAQITEPSANDASVKWVSFSQSSIVAQPGQMNTINMTIKPDETASFGYYYAVVFTKQGANSSQGSNSVSGSTAVLVLVDVQVPGEKRQLRVADFTARHSVFEFLPATLDVTVKNTGNVHAIPTGDIFISRNKKEEIATLPINAAESNVLPGSSRKYTVSWDDGFPAHIVKRVGGQIVTDKNGQPETTLSWASSKLNKFRFGKYYAHLVFVYNNGTQDVPVESVISFWVIPWKIILLVTVILAALLYAAITLLRKSFRLGKKAVRRDGKA